MQLTQKEAGLLKDLKDQEKLCIEKYSKHADAANDTQLKDLFNKIVGIEQGHYNTIEQLEKGQTPVVSGSADTKMTFTATYGKSDDPQKQHDCYLCSDLLSTEKHVSHLYDVCVFEFKDESHRNVLNHIQKEEQGHGKMIYDYMSVNGMYS